MLPAAKGYQEASIVQGVSFFNDYPVVNPKQGGQAWWISKAVNMMDKQGGQAG